MNIIEQNIILYYADFLSLKDTSTPVTDNCKYYFVYDYPMNSAYLVNNTPFFDPENKYYVQAYTEYEVIKNKFGDTGVKNFIEDICNLSAQGCVGAREMLKCIHQYSTKQERRSAMNRYERWLDNITYYHYVVGEDGERKKEPCNKYVAHLEQNTESSPEIQYRKDIDDSTDKILDEERQKRLIKMLYTD